MNCDIRVLEEYPTRKNLEKQKYLDFPYKLVLAATSLEQFKERRELAIETANKGLEGVLYWPVFDNVVEGEMPKNLNAYWASPLAQSEDLKKLLGEVVQAQNEGIQVMVDIEWPLLKRRWYFDIDNLVYLYKKSILEAIVRHPNVSTFESANYPDPIMEFLGMGFNPVKHKNKERIKMLYKFAVPLARLNNPEVKRRIIKEGVEKFGDKFAVALGCLALGVFNNEPIISPAELREEIKITIMCGVERIYIFRLGGMNEKYADAIKHGLNFYSNLSWS
ncbi:hypothetical protein HYU07_07230 [Candidatus Woesearchaeota archaeon]|nr:hypothetical protein [Candidatus Woesearchaeota archaeon]